MKEKDAFDQFHPLTLFVFLAGCIVLQLCSLHPFMLVSGIVISQILVSRRVKNRKYLSIVIIGGLLLIIGGIVNAIGYHDGLHILFYVNDTPYTLEAFVAGVHYTALILAVFSWFLVYQIYMTEERFLYLFGRISPTLALTISMICRFVPLLKERYSKIHEANRCMGAYEKGGWLIYVKQRGKELSTLVSFSLEESVETADSMQARGYGIPERTSFHRFVWMKKDTVVSICMLLLIVGCALTLGAHVTRVYFYPSYGYKYGKEAIIPVVFYMVLGFMPMITQKVFQLRKRGYER